MAEQLQDTGIEEAVEQRTVGLSASHWLRLAYVFEYMLALQAALMLWTQVGGEGHMDLLPWYLKLCCIAFLALCVVQFTSGLVEQERFWNRKSRFWFGTLLFTAMLMGSITFYYHLHEASDDSETDQTSAALVRNSGPDEPAYRA